MSPGEQLLYSLNSLVNMVRIYQGNNQLISNCLAQFSESAALLMGGDGLLVQLENGRFFINEGKLLRRRGAVERWSSATSSAQNPLQTASPVRWIP